MKLIQYSRIERIGYIHNEKKYFDFHFDNKEYVYLDRL